MCARYPILFPMFAKNLSRFHKCVSSICWGFQLQNTPCYCSIQELWEPIRWHNHSASACVRLVNCWYKMPALWQNDYAIVAQNYVFENNNASEFGAVFVQMSVLFQWEAVFVQIQCMLFHWNFLILWYHLEICDSTIIAFAMALRCTSFKGHEL